MTLREYIIFWQETYDSHQSRPTTYAAHNYVFKNHILPGLGDIPLSELTSEMVGEFLEERRRFGNHRPGSSGLGEETMRHIHRLLQQCLDQAIRDGLLTENPAKAFRYRKSTTVKANIMTPLEMEDYGWGSSTIVNILKKREYLGHTINFKTRKHFKDKKSHYVSEDEWTIFENTHEAIIDQQTFDLAQKIRSNVRRYPNGWGEAAPLTGLLYCADCGGKMYVHRTNNGKRVSQYTCSNYTKVPCGTLCPTQHRINESAVLTLVSDTLRAIAEYSRNDRTEFIHTVQETQVAQQSADISKKRRRLAAAQKRAGELEKLICKIYEDNALGKLPDARYRALDAQYAKEQGALEIEIAELEKAVTGYEQSQKSAEKFIALIDKYENFDTKTGYEVMQSYVMHKPANDPIFTFIEKKRGEGKSGKLAMVAGLNKFLRVYYGKVTELYRSLPAIE